MLTPVVSGELGLTPALIAAGVLVYNVATYGAVGDGVADDTVAIQKAINAAVANGGIAYLPAGTYLVTQLTYNGGNWTLAGSGMTSSILKQKNGQASWVLGAIGTGWPYKRVRFCDFGVECSANTGSNIGGIYLQGSAESILERLYVAHANSFGIQVIGGGSATTGDAMYCVIDKCSIQNLGASAVHIKVSPAAAVGSTPGSHPDRLKIRDCFFNSVYANATTGIQIDVAPTLTSALSSDGVHVAGVAMQGVKFPFDVNTQDSLFVGNTAECTGTGQTMTVIVQAGPANYPSTSNLFVGNEYATQGVAGNFTFTDNGVGTLRLEWNITPGGIGAAVGLQANKVYADAIGVFGSAGNTLLSLLNTVISTTTRISLPHFGMKKMQSAPTIATGVDPGIFNDNNNAIGLYALGGANGGVRTWLDTGSGNATQSNVLDDGSGGMSLAAGAKILSGTGTPAGNISAPTGSIFLRTDGGANTTLYVKESGTGTSGWAAK